MGKPISAKAFISAQKEIFKKSLRAITDAALDEIEPPSEVSTAVIDALAKIKAAELTLYALGGINDEITDSVTSSVSAACEAMDSWRLKLRPAHA